MHLQIKLINKFQIGEKNVKEGAYINLGKISGP